METPEERHERRQAALVTMRDEARAAGFPCDDADTLLVFLSNHRDYHVERIEVYGAGTGEAEWTVELQWPHPEEPDDDRAIWLRAVGEGETLVMAALHAVSLRLYAARELGA